MQRMTFSAILGLSAWIVGPVSAATAQDPFWLHPYNFFGEETALTASVNLGDLDGDGDLDAAVARDLMPVLRLFNDGQGGLARIERFGADTDVVFGLALADFNHDGRIDIAVANGGVRNRVCFAAADGFTALEVGDEALDTYNLSVGDLNDDGRPDIVYAVSEGSNYSLINRIEPD